MMSGLFAQLVLDIGREWRVFLIAASFGTALELLMPIERHSLMSRVRGAVFQSIYLTLGVALAFAVSTVWWRLGIRPLFHADLTQTVVSDNLFVRGAAFVAFPFFGVLAYDFFYYWLHRLQHTVPILWRLHSVHHSIEELNSVNCYHHFTDQMQHAIFIGTLSSLLYSLSVPQFALVTLMFDTLGKAQHSASRLSFGPLKYIFSEPRYHRLHHSLEERHWGKNFAFATPLWDQLFGTAYFPRHDEHHKTGLAERREPRTLREYLLPRSPGQT